MMTPPTTSAASSRARFSRRLNGTEVSAAKAL